MKTNTAFKKSGERVMFQLSHLPPSPADQRLMPSRPQGIQQGVGACEAGGRGRGAGGGGPEGGVGGGAASRGGQPNLL